VKLSLPRWLHLNGATTAVTLVAAGGLLFTISPETVVTAFSSGTAASAPTSQVGARAAAAPVEDEPAEDEETTGLEPVSSTGGSGAGHGSRDGAGERNRSAAERADDDTLLDGGVEPEDVPQPIGPDDLEGSGDLREEVEAQIQSMGGTASGAPYDFMLTQFNILGSNHTRGSRTRFAPGTVRTGWAVDYLERWGSDVVGFSEIQKDQLAVFMRDTGGAFDVWPGTALGNNGVPQSLVWRKSLFTATAKESVTIPFMGQRRPQPVVRLKHNGTGRELWVVNVHNAPRSRESERDQAMGLELAVVNELRRTGLPVLFIGDMNEKEEIFCAVTGRTDLYSPRGGSRGGACRPPSGMRVDWIFGSSDVRFSGYTDEKTAELRRITDHGVLHSRVTIP
jgi:endonuclease/exonuclease/phosphatase family metal-dependent hydrolase